MDPSEEFSHKYVAILRCRTWGTWPEWSRCFLPAYQEPLPLPDGRRILLSIHLATYAKRERPENGPPKPLDKTAGPIVWRGHMETGYWMGTQYLKAPKDELLLGLEYEPPYEGEVDIQLHIGLKEPVNLHDLARVASPISISVLALMNVSVGDFLVPVAPLQVSALGDGGSQIENSVIIAVRQRPQVAMDTAKAVIEGFVRTRARMSRDEAHAVSVAARRYVTSQTETDPIDKYCDLWESCEFATFFQKAKGDKVGRVAEALTSHWNQASHRAPLRKSDVERVLEIKQLYEIRGRIVHEALDSPEDLCERIAMLEAVAAELLRYHLGVPFSETGPVFERLSALTR